MKLLGAVSLLIAALMNSSAAHAKFSPHVGDYVVEKITDQTGQWTSKTWIESHDVKNDIYRVYTSRVEADGKETLLTQKSVTGQVLKTFYISDIKKFCKTRALGQLEKISLLPGNFQACHDAVTTWAAYYNYFWAAHVPFGKLSSESGVFPESSLAVKKKREVITIGYGHSR